MRLLTVILCSLISTMIYSQSARFDKLLQQGKEEFYKDYESQDYRKAAENLEKAVKINPDNAEAHYFLGYAYSRLNSSDGEGIIYMSRQLTLKASEHMETVNKLTPKYEGEIVALDPYSKLTAEWGSLAMCYLYNGKPDSAKWAFKEGKLRGGFGEFFLSISRKTLDFCSENAILISSGDNITMPLWYLQNVENYRPDVTVIDISLLNSTWYPKYLLINTNVTFGSADQNLDAIQHMEWADSLITIDINENNKFSWEVLPSYDLMYLLRGDVLFLNLLISNKFEREVCFTSAFNEDMQLSLQDYLNSSILIHRINYNQQPEILVDEYKDKISNVIGSLKYLNTNSQAELSFVEAIRFDLFLRINGCLENGDKEGAKSLMEILDKNINSQDYPYQSGQMQELYDNLKQRL